MAGEDPEQTDPDAEGSHPATVADRQNRTNTPPSREDYKPREWQKAHKPNLTGTAMAYRPKGSLLAGGERPRVTGDYDAWTPRS